MYTLKVNDELLYSPAFDDLAMINVKASIELNKTGTLQFQMPPGHPLFDAVNKIQSDIYLYEDDVLLWKFRVLNDELDFTNVKNVMCEGELSYLLDSIQRPFEFQGRVKDFFTQLINVHNSQVEARKQFKVGTVNVVDTNDYINRSDGHISTTLAAANEKLVKTHAGYLRTRHVGNDAYIDYLADYGVVSTQEIRFGENLLDITRFIKGEHIRTAIIPLGAESDEDGINGVKKRLGISSVNGGEDYVFDQTAVNLFGWIWDTVEFDDVTIAQNLKSKGEAYLRELINFQMQLELTAFDLHLLNVDIAGIRLGDWIRVVSAPHELDKLFLVSKIDIDVSNPSQSKIYLGGTIQTFTAKATRDKKDISEAVKQVATSAFKEINDKIENATELLTGAEGGYLVISRDANGKPYELLLMDAPALDDAVKLLRINKNGLGFSTTGKNGPYKNAWTIDGVLIADFIGAGTMLCDRIRGGMLELGGGNTTNGVMRILNASGEQIGRWDRNGITVTEGTITANAIKTGEMSCNRLRGGTLELGAKAGKVDGSLSVVDATDFTMLQANKNGVGIGGDYLHYRASGGSQGDNFFGVGGFNIIERSTPGYEWYYYWETETNRANGLATGGPWIVWGGWNKADPYNAASYKFVAFADGKVKVTSLINSSRATEKENIVEFTGSGLGEVKKTKVYEYDLRDNGDHHTGFVIGDDYDISKRVIDKDASAVELYDALALSYKAIQELGARVEALEKKLREGENG